MADATEISKFERLAFKPIPLWIVVLSWLTWLLFAIFFGYAVWKHDSDPYASRQPMKWFGDTAFDIVSAPSTLRAYFGPSPATVGGTYPKLPNGFWRNPADRGPHDDGFALVTRFQADKERYVVELLRLSDGHVMKEYDPDYRAIDARSGAPLTMLEQARDRGTFRYRPGHPYLMPDGGLMFRTLASLVRIDACGKILWTDVGNFHHSIEKGVDGNFWIPMTLPASRLENVSPTFREDGLANVDVAGKVLRFESLVDIFARNDLTDLWRGKPYYDDPFHLNDIQPVLADGPYWRRGDVFLSMPGLSLIALYRPSTGKLIWWRQGPWHFQHDINILDDHRISIFDNNSRGGSPDFVDGHNRVVIVDFAANRIDTWQDDAMKREQFRTVAEGRATPMGDGGFIIEETRFGRVVRLGADGQVRWRYVTADKQGQRYVLGWNRYLDWANFGGAIEQSLKAKCT